MDPIQWRYELIRPLVLFADRTAQQRAQETDTHPDTVRTLQRRFLQQGMLRLVPGSLEVTPRGRATRVPDAVRQGIDRLKALYAGFHYGELARILFFTFGYPIHHNTVKQLWHQSPMTAPQQPARGDYHAQPNRAHAPLQMVQLYYQGWDKMSLSRFFRISRPTVDRWIARFETNHFAGLMDHKRGPQSPREVWFPVMVAVIISKSAIPMLESFVSGACWCDQTSPCAPSAVLWPLISGWMTISRMCAKKVRSRRPNHIRIKPAILASFGSSTAA
jgi:hypothetical protein